MATIYLDSSSNEQYHEHQFFSPSHNIHHHELHQFFSPSHHQHQFLSPSNTLTCHLFFKPAITTHDQDPSQNHEDDSFGSQTTYDDVESYDHITNDEKQLKMKKKNPTKLNSSLRKEVNFEDHKSVQEETIISTSNFPINIRVCSDCNTTKTPLWRSGPQGPKSLCNACGIRQRKARKAMAAASSKDDVYINDKAAAGVSLKLGRKIYKKPNKKKMMMSRPAAIAIARRKNKINCSSSSVEEFLRKNLAFHCHVFPQHDKEAAILLMALSSSG
ncbi:hypothetical protein QVD17_03398 [Tagetes erecta]|uniref:GATA-type domain-containing protein n=1 Tax=Tagetes erecta TaxID=13708 RepID=A0AAD8LB77_TARER|nr:hypothetical protein QVD17_03398 [Tagetes erecta]